MKRRKIFLQSGLNLIARRKRLKYLWDHVFFFSIKKDKKILQLRNFKGIPLKMEKERKMKNAFADDNEQACVKFQGSVW